MPRKTTGQPPSEPVKLTAPRSQVAAELDDRIAAGEAFLLRPINSSTEIQRLKAEYRTWDEFNQRLLKARFTTDEIERDYTPVMYFGSAFSSPQQEARSLVNEIERAVRKLRSIKEQLPLIPEPTVAPSPSRPPAAHAGGNAIFVVHGHNEQRRLEVTSFLEKVTPIDVIVLREKANQGRTIIEKFEDYASSASYAVVLLTGDDRGAPTGMTEQKPRARQNVVFELGFFFGALRRSRVAVLYEEDVELPSDVHGLLYVPLDVGGAWRMNLAKELKAAGITVDLNKVL